MHWATLGVNKFRLVFKIKICRVAPKRTSSDFLGHVVSGLQLKGITNRFRVRF